MTVKGVGHMVPEDNPKVGKKLLDNFIQLNKAEEEEWSKSQTKQSEVPGESEPEKDGFPIWAIIIIVVVGVLLVALIVFIIIRKRKKGTIDVNETDHLMGDINVEN